jgi:hypothetical protein
MIIRNIPVGILMIFFQFHPFSLDVKRETPDNFIIKSIPLSFQRPSFQMPPSIVSIRLKFSRAAFPA